MPAASSKHNLPAILQQNKLKSLEGLIYTCPTYEDALAFICYSQKWLISDCVVLELHLQHTEYTNYRESFDHNKKYIPARALVFRGKELPFTSADVINF